MPFTLTFNDNFTRGNTVVGAINSTTGVGNGWVDVSGSTWSISGNKAIASSSAVSKADYLRYLRRRERAINQRVVFNWDGTGGFRNVYLRLDPNTDSNYYFQIHPVSNGNSTLAMGRMINGNATVLQSQTFAFTAGNTYQLTGTVTGLNPTIVSASFQNLTTSTTVATFSVNDSTASLQRSGFLALAGATYPINYTLVEYYEDSIKTLVNANNIAFSPYNWQINSNISALTNNPGAYLDLTFNGTYLELLVDNSALIAAGIASGSYPQLRWSIDNRAWQNALLNSTNDSVVLGSGLTLAEHHIRIYFLSSDYTLQRWNTEVGSLKLLGFLSLVSSSVTPVVKAKKAIIYGDSITEGILINDGSFPSASVLSYAALIGQALSAEYGQIGWGGQGWAVPGTGGVPKFTDTWNNYRAGMTRLVSGKLSPTPDTLIIVHGINDALATTPATDAEVTSAVTSWLAQARNATSIDCQIYVVAPFGAFKKSAIALGVQSYKTATGDRKAYFVDAGSEAAKGITSFSLGATVFGNDGIHPTVYNSSRLATILMQAMAASASENISIGTSGVRSLSLNL